MNVIVTGATGFVGQNLSRYLTDKNINVQCLSLRNKNWEKEINQNSDAIIHLAGKAHDVSNLSEEQVYFDVNYNLTVEVFNVFLESKIKNFIFLSSVKAVADTIDTILTEDIKANPKTVYGKSKHKAELFLLSKRIPNNKRLFVFRPCMIHGPGNKGNLNLLHTIINKGIPWPLASFKNKRSFLSVDNLSFCIYKTLINDDVKSGVYNVSDDESLSTNEIVDLLAKCSNKEVRLWKINKGLIVFFSKIGDFLRLPLNSERLKKLTESYEVSNQKIKTELKINRLPLSAKEGILLTLKSFNKL